MAEISAFRGLRYDTAKVGKLADLFAPPYDVIDERMRGELLSRSKCNIARVTRSPEAEREPEEKRYSAAAALLRQWRAQGLLRRDEAPSLYAYEEEFMVGGTTFRRMGLVGALRLADFGQGVHPHEETLSGPKRDRRLLLDQTRMHLGQIFGLYPDEAGEVNAAIAAALGGRRPDAEADDGDGVRHRLWVISDGGAVRRLSGLLSGRDVFIADGHHRYETALQYSREHPELPAARNVMATLVALSDPGLVVLPTHRLVHSLAGFDLAGLEKRLAENFSVERIPFAPSAREAELARLLSRMTGLRRAGRNAFGLYGGGGHFSLLTLAGPAAMKAAEPSHGDAWRALDVAVLHTLVLDRLLGIDRAKLAAKTNLDYLKDTGDAIGEAVARIDAGQAQCVFMMNSTGVGEVAAVATGGEKMPQKSTFFHPKIFTGMVLMPLED